MAVRMLRLAGLERSGRSDAPGSESAERFVHRDGLTGLDDDNPEYFGYWGVSAGDRPPAIQGGSGR